MNTITTAGRALAKVVRPFRSSNDLSSQLEDARARASKIEADITSKNTAYFANKVDDPDLAGKLKTEVRQLRLDLEDVNDEIVALEARIKDSQKDERASQRAKEREMIEREVAIDLKFLERYAKFVAEISEHLDHLQKTEELVAVFNRTREGDEPAIAAAEQRVRFYPGTPARFETRKVKRPKAVDDSYNLYGDAPFDLVEETREVIGSGSPPHQPVPLFESVSLPPLKRGDHFRRARVNHW
jgi:hypothetical protein